MAKTLATFRIDENLWDEFKQLAEREETNASAELVKFVLMRLGKLDNNLEGVNTETLDSRISSYLEKNLDKYLTKDDLEKALEPIKNDLQTAIVQLNNKLESLSSKESGGLSFSDIANQLNQIKTELATFDKAFESLGSTVHDQLLSQPVASKDELYNAIASLQTEIEGLKKQSAYLKNDEVEDRQQIRNEDNQSTKGITKATLDPIFDDASIPKDALSQADLAKYFGVNDSSVKRSLDKGNKYFLQWSRKNDPKSQAWQYIGEFINPETKRLGKYFKPVG